MHTSAHTHTYIYIFTSVQILIDPSKTIISFGYLQFKLKKTWLIFTSVFVSHNWVTPLPVHKKHDFIFSHFTYLLKTSPPYNKFPNHIQLHQPNTQLQQGWEGEKKRFSNTLTFSTP